MASDKKVFVDADLKEELKKSRMPISAFFLVEDEQSKLMLFELLDYLKNYGIQDSRISKMKDVVETVLNYLPKKKKPRSKMTNFQYDYQGKKILGFFEFRHSEGNKFLAELQLPGPMAAEAEDLFNKDFWTEFKPFIYYD